MIILRQYNYSRSSKKDDNENTSDEEDKKAKRNKRLGTAAAIGSVGVLSTIKPSRLTGKVVRYHSTDNSNVESILKEGLKAKYAEDPNNLTNRVLRDIDMSKKKGLVYTSRNKRVARDAAVVREYLKHPNIFKSGPDLEDYKNARKNQKILKLVFDYDTDIKGKPKIENPELRGAKNWREFHKIRKDRGESPLMSRITYKRLNDDTHIFRGDIDPSHIVGGQGYKKRSLKQVGNYIKNNPGRFAKEALKVGAGLTLGGLAINRIVKSKKEKQKKKEKKEEENKNSK